MVVKLSAAGIQGQCAQLRRLYESYMMHSVPSVLLVHNQTFPTVSTGLPSPALRRTAGRQAQPDLLFMLGPHGCKTLKHHIATIVCAGSTQWHSLHNASCCGSPVQEAAEERWGDVTTDESDSELTHYRSKRAEALEASTSVFADASEEYGSLAAVKDRLEKWKQQHAGAYADAYMSLSVPAVMAPFVRLELLHWDPLFGGGTGQCLLQCAPCQVI